jgi:acyl-coenzyme A synthetase/AMP-(fatty) acid ligase
MIDGEERHTHVDLAKWVERYLTDDEGRALRLQEFQRDILRRIGSGERVVIYNARNPEAAAILALLRLAIPGAIVIEGNMYQQAERVFQSAVANIVADHD